MVVPENSAVKIRDDMPLDKAALIGCAVTTGAGAVINTARVKAGASLAIFGTGGIGLNAIQGGRYAAHTRSSPWTCRQQARVRSRTWATHTVNGARDEVVETIRKLTDGRGAE